MTDERVPLAVAVVRSAKRRKSVGAQLRNGVVTVTIPAWMSSAEEAEWVNKMVGRFERRRNSDAIDLRRRARDLAAAHDLPVPTEIRWVDDMTTRWGSCTPGTATIRLSTRLARFPSWVLDYVIVHELAHLVVGGHGPDFWRLVHRYPRTERAIGYLIAKAGESDDDDTNHGEPDAPDADGAC